MTRLIRIFAGPDSFSLYLVGTVLAASLAPARGPAAQVFEFAADIAIALLFFLHGAKLSPQAIITGIGAWRLHLLVLGSTFILFPLLGAGFANTLQSLITPEVLTGLLYLTLLPSTVQSSIAFTSIAGGNVPAAVCSASLSNLAGIVVTPLLVGLLMQVDQAGEAMDKGRAVAALVTQLLLPFVLGHLARPLLGPFIDRNKKILTPLDRSSILLVVYSAFSAAVLNGIWSRLGLADLSIVLAVSAAMLALVMLANLGVARLLNMRGEDEVVLLFCGSKKSLVSGVPMAGALFPAAQVGLLILPLMIFHQLQLLVCTLIAARYRNAAALDQGARS